METFQQNVPSSCSETERILRLVREGGYEVKIRRGVRRLPVFKYLLGELLYGDGLDVSAYLTLWHLWEWISRKNDPIFKQTYQNQMSLTQEIMKEAGRRSNVFPVQIRVSSDVDLAKSLCPTPQAYYGLKGQREIRQSFKLLLNSLLPSQHLPPKRFIGRGYDDEGTYRNTATNGTPHWTEVAVDWKNRGLFPEDPDPVGNFVPI